MSPQEVLSDCGGVAETALLRARCGKRRLRLAIESGDVVRLRRGWYGLRGLGDAERLSIELSGTIAGPSAALAWGWSLKHAPDRPHLGLLKGRRLSPQQRAQIHPLWWEIRGDELMDERGVRIQTPLATAVQCLRILPFEEGLAVADSALRSGRVRRDELLSAIAAAPRTGRTRAVKVATAADGRAANAFESCLRAICSEVRQLHVEPQVQIGDYRVDLADRGRRIVIEADSRTWHAGPAEHNADIRRYTTLVREGWIVIRFSYDDVMHDPAYVRAVLLDALAIAA